VLYILARRSGAANSQRGFCRLSHAWLRHLHRSVACGRRVLLRKAAALRDRGQTPDAWQEAPCLRHDSTHRPPPPMPAAVASRAKSQARRAGWRSVWAAGALPPAGSRRPATH